DVHVHAEEMVSTGAGVTEQQFAHLIADLTVVAVLNFHRYALRCGGTRCSGQLLNGQVLLLFLPLCGLQLAKLFRIGLTVLRAVRAAPVIGNVVNLLIKADTVISSRAVVAENHLATLSTDLAILAVYDGELRL